MLPVSDDMWILYKNRIPIEKVKTALEIPRMNPLGLQYKRWWKEEKRKCVDGVWVEHLGSHKKVSGPLYFYVNFWKILLTPKNSKTTNKKLGVPFLRDLEWVRSFVYEEARGFSGYELDDEFTCHRIYELVNPEEDPERFEELLMEYGNPDLIRSSILRKDGTFKTYVPAREYLKRYFNKPLGKTLYYNMASNVVDMESRGGGKSYWKANIIAHNFIFDGSKDYDDYLENKAQGFPLSSESLVGAIDTKYTNDLISKIKLGMENLPGKTTIGEEVYPSPFSRKYYGSWESGKTITAGYDKKVGGQWEKVGTKSKIQHRSFKDNHKAANGTRPNLSVIDEVGFMGNLVSALGQMKETAADGTVKAGVIWMTGTGGDMAGGATEEVKQVFYSPETFDCLAFDDEFEGYQTKIGFFVPAWMTLNQFKDELGNTNWKLAIAYLERTREKLKKQAKKKDAYEDEIVQRPIIHSEVFLLNNTSILPVADLKEHMDNLLSMGNEPGIKGLHGWMHLDASGEPYFKLDPDNYKPTDYPVKASDDNHGAVVIWEEPDPRAEYGWYAGGIDPYDFDIAPNSVSLGSIMIFQRGSIYNGGYDRQVAEYTGRPHLASDFFEQARRLIAYYNGIALYENEKQLLKEHFKARFSIHLLAFTPGVLKANETSKTAAIRSYGQHMSTPVKAEAEIYTREWLLTPIGDGKLQLHTIKSIPLLKELIGYNAVGNFDRVIALFLVVIQLTQMKAVVIEESKAEVTVANDDFFNRRLFSR